MAGYLIAPGAEVVVAAGALHGFALPARPGRERVAVFTQPGAAAAVADRVAAQLGGDLLVAVQILPDRDAAKTPETVTSAYRWLTDLGLHRQDTVVAVGGGALTDVAGFVAATYLRGIEAVYVPTTLLGAVDAAIGGKTGINLDGKNLIGAFRHPRLVVVDTDLLIGLPTALWEEGMAEALKAGMVGDPALVDLLERTGRAAPIDEVVQRAVAVKAGIVAEDFEERGSRAFLNFGHTVGHAIETILGLSHGHAVAVGMVAEAAASEAEMGFTGAGRLRHLVATLGSPVSAAGAGAVAVREMVKRDKKRDAAGTRMVLLEDVGRPVLRHVGEDVLDAAFAAVTG